MRRTDIGTVGLAGAPVSKADRAYQAILEGIRDQRHEPGDRLVLSQIAAELGMSVVPVREAIRRLQSEKLVAYERNVGATVVGIDPVEYRHTMETLALVEGFSTAQCAPHVTAEDLAAAREVNATMRAMTESETAWDPVTFTELNRRFHSILFEHHQNEHVHDLVHRGWNRLAALRSSTFAYVPGRAVASVDEHEHLLRLIEDGEEALTKARRDVAVATEAYDVAAMLLTSAREAAGDRLVAAVMDELGPLKLERARFRVTLEPIEGRRGPLGVETVRFEVATNAGTAFGPLDTVASGGELARFALAMKAALASREDQRQPVMIFDEVDQGVGGAVAEAVGVRLQRLSGGAQVLVVTHSPQVAALGGHHFRVAKSVAAGMTTSTVAALDDQERVAEIARMLAGEEVTPAAKEAARALLRG